MKTNLTKYKNDLERLIKTGDLLYVDLVLGFADEELKKKVLKDFKDVKMLSFKKDYESWYSESFLVLKQLLPDRLDDFIKLYKNEKRKEITFLTYTISDYMIGLRTSRAGETIADGKDACPKFEQQLNILKSVSQRFESSLFDIKQLLQADVFDDELESARELLNKGFVRGAGAISGVVLEKHLLQVCHNHNVKLRKKHPSLGDYNEALKKEIIIDVATWRFISHLADIRNLCSHKKKKDPKEEDVSDLIDGVDKATKTLF